MNTVVSADGTAIAYERKGAGNPVILVGGALSSRMTEEPLAGLLAAHATVFTYDRRGRGASGDTAPYAVAREVEDIAALIAEAGGSAGLYGMSSGGALVLRAAADGLPVTRVALYEAPFAVEELGTEARHQYTAKLTELLTAGRRGDAVELFMTAVGVPADVIGRMRVSPLWQGVEDLAHTLAYDDAILEDGVVPTGRLAAVTQPVLVADGGASAPWMHDAAQAVADALPDGRRATLGGQTHAVNPAVLAPVLAEFFAPGEPEPSGA